MTALRFPAESAVGELWWEDDPETGRWGHQLAIGMVEVPDGTAVQLNAGRHGGDAVDLEFIRGLPADSVFDLSVGDIVPASFAAVAHLAPGLRGLGRLPRRPRRGCPVRDRGTDGPRNRCRFTATHGPEDGPSLRLDDHALSVIADLPALE